MVIFTSILVLSMIVFSNVLFYTVVLLFMSTFVLVYLVASDIMSILVLLLILIVYVGAMMILIGYICAVCPNFITVTKPTPQAILGLLIFIFFVNQFSLSESAKTIYLLDYFLSYWGMLSFFMIVVMLFFTLLMVTSQYSSPQGPFRSLN